VDGGSGGGGCQTPDPTRNGRLVRARAAIQTTVTVPAISTTKRTTCHAAMAPPVAVLWPPYGAERNTEMAPPAWPEWSSWAGDDLGVIGGHDRS
jgi:hypothetical protein